MTHCFDALIKTSNVGVKLPARFANSSTKTSTCKTAQFSSEMCDTATDAIAISRLADLNTCISTLNV